MSIGSSPGCGAILPRSTSEVDFRDLRQALEAYGWRVDYQEGSHVYFTKPGQPSLSIPLVSERRVKRVYIRQALRLIGEES